jgi:hypothetical protein
MICISFQYYQGNQAKNDDIVGTSGIYRGEGRCKQGFGFGTLRETGCSEDLDVDGRTILKWILNKSVVRAWTGLVWLRTEISGGLLIKNLIKFGSDEMRGIE